MTTKVLPIADLRLPIAEPAKDGTPSADFAEAEIAAATRRQRASIEEQLLKIRLKEALRDVFQ